MHPVSPAAPSAAETARNFRRLRPAASAHARFMSSSLKATPPPDSPEPVADANALYRLSRSVIATCKITSRAKRCQTGAKSPNFPLAGFHGHAILRSLSRRAVRNGLRARQPSSVGARMLRRMLLGVIGTMAVCGAVAGKPPGLPLDPHSEGRE